MKRFLAVLLATSVYIPIVVSNQAAGFSDGLYIAGHWKINTELSDDPAAIMEERMKSMRGKGPNGGMGGPPGGGMGGTPGGGMGRPGRGGGMGGPPGGGAPDPKRLQEQLGRFGEIVILQNDEDIRMVYAKGDTMTVIPDGKKRKYKTLLGEREVWAKWEDLKLTLRTRRGSRPEVTQWITIDDNGRLEVTAKVSPPRGEAIEVVTRYDQVTDG